MALSKAVLCSVGGWSPLQGIRGPLVTLKVCQFCQKETMPAKLHQVFLNFIWSQILSIKKHLLTLPGKGMRGVGGCWKTSLCRRKHGYWSQRLKIPIFFIWDKPKWAQETEENMNMIKLNYREHSKANCKVSQELNQHFCHAQSPDWLQ